MLILAFGLQLAINDAVKLTVIHDKFEIKTKTHKRVSQGWPMVVIKAKKLARNRQIFRVTWNRLLLKAINRLFKGFYFYI